MVGNMNFLKDKKKYIIKYTVEFILRFVTAVVLASMLTLISSYVFSKAFSFLDLLRENKIVQILLAVPLFLGAITAIIIEIKNRD